MSVFAGNVGESGGKSPKALAGQCAEGRFEETLALMRSYALSSTNEASAIDKSLASRVKSLLSAKFPLPEYDEDDLSEAGDGSEAGDRSDCDSDDDEEGDDDDDDHSVEDEGTPLTLVHIAAHAALASPSATTHDQAFEVFSLVLSSDGFQASKSTAGHQAGHTILSTALDVLTTDPALIPPATTLARLQKFFSVLLQNPHFNINMPLLSPPANDDDEFVTLRDAHSWSPAVMLLQVIAAAAREKSSADDGEWMISALQGSSSNPSDLTMRSPSAPFAPVDYAVALLDPAHGYGIDTFARIMSPPFTDDHMDTSSPSFATAKTVLFLLTGTGSPPSAKELASCLATALPPLALPNIRGATTVFEKLLLFDATLIRLNATVEFQDVVTKHAKGGKGDVVENMVSVLYSPPFAKERSDRVINSVVASFSDKQRLALFASVTRKLANFASIVDTLGKGLLITLDIDRGCVDSVLCNKEIPCANILGLIIKGYVDGVCRNYDDNVKWIDKHVAVNGGSMAALVSMSDVNGRSGVDMCEVNARALIEKLGDLQLTAVQWGRLGRICVKDSDVASLVRCLEGGKEDSAWLGDMARLCFDYRCGVAKVLLMGDGRDDELRRKVLWCLKGAAKNSDELSGFSVLHECCRSLVLVAGGRSAAAVEKQFGVLVKDALELCCFVVGEEGLAEKCKESYGGMAALDVLEGEDWEWARKIVRDCFAAACNSNK
jgi:hypothetical protein